MFVERKYSYKNNEHNLKVLKYNSGGFTPVFEGGYTYSALHSRYASDFSYSVVPNSNNSKLKDTIRFSFDGNKYVPDKKTDGYVNFKFNTQ